MGVLEITIAVFATFGTLSAASAVMGAVLGGRRRIGSAKGFVAGLILPLVGVGLVALSRKKECPDTMQRTPERMPLKEDARRAAREQFRRDRPVTVKKEKYKEAVRKPQQEQSEGRVMRR